MHIGTVPCIAGIPWPVLLWQVCALIAIFVIYLKNHGYLEFTNEEHLHDLGKFMFAFSIFWTYLWFSQYMLIWYSNQPEETIYFKPQQCTEPLQGDFLFKPDHKFCCAHIDINERGSKTKLYYHDVYVCITIIWALARFFSNGIPGAH